MKIKKIKKNLILFLLFLLSISLIGCSSNCENGKHNSEWIITLDSTCTSLGSKELRCKDCKKILTTAIIDYKDHSVVIDNKKEATCTNDGLTEGSHCSECDMIIISQEIIKASGHNYILDSSLSTDTKLVYKCENCGHSYNQVTEEGCENHVASEWIVLEEATCEKNGSKHKVCINCNVEMQIQSIPTLDHKEVIIKGKEATCTNDGLSDGSKCEDCGKVIKEPEVIEKLGHNYVVTNTVSPTQNTSGYIEYTCLVCSDSYKSEIKDLGNYDATSPTTILLSNKGITVSNNNGGVIVNNSEVTINIAGEYDLIGELSEGSIIVKVAETDKVIINLRGVKLSSSKTNPIFIETGDKIEISAKSGTVNYINDKRIVEEDATGAAIYSKVDLEIKG